MATVHSLVPGIIILAMCNFKKIYYCILLLAIASCSPYTYKFNTAGVVNNSLQTDPYFLSSYVNKQKGIQLNNVTELRMYCATITEKMVENNSVGEYKLLNTYSKQPTINKGKINYYHKIYLVLFNIDSGMVKKFVLLSTGYNADNVCLSFGPAYIGSVNTSKLNPSLIIEYELKKRQNSNGWYLMNNYRKKNNIEWLTQKPIMPDNSVDSLQQFYMIIQNNRNKIGGMNKPVIFNVPQIFNDSAALTFELIYHTPR